MDPKGVTKTNDIKDEVAAMKSKAIFNRKIQCSIPKCTPLLEKECGPRAILSLFIIDFGLYESASLEILMKEACSPSIVQEDILPHHSRELFCQAGLNIKKTWNIDNIFPKDSNIYKNIQKNDKQSQMDNQSQKENKQQATAGMEKKILNICKKRRKISKRIKKRIKKAKAKDNANSFLNITNNDKIEEKIMDKTRSNSRAGKELNMQPKRITSSINLKRKTFHKARQHDTFKAIPTLKGKKTHLQYTVYDPAKLVYV